MVSSSLFLRLAQLVEQQTFNLWVPGSNPGGGTNGTAEKRIRW